MFLQFLRKPSSERSSQTFRSDFSTAFRLTAWLMQECTDWTRQDCASAVSEYSARYAFATASNLTFGMTAYPGAAGAAAEAADAPVQDEAPLSSF